MTIQGLVTELKDLNTEIKRMSRQISELRKQKAGVEEQIVNYLNEKEQPGLKYNDTAIILEKKSLRSAKKKSEADIEAVQILENHGIENPQEVLKEILNSRKGEEFEREKIKLKLLK
jgi:hypothetical protein